MIKSILIAAVLAAQKPFEQRCPELITPDTKVGIFASTEQREQYFACLDARDEKHATTELIVNAGQGYTGRVKQLLDYGADPSLQTSEGWTALMHAATSGFPRISGHLLQAGADINQTTKLGQTAIFLAATTNQIDMLKFLIAQGADIDLSDSYNYTPLMMAAAHGNLEVVQILIQAGAKLDIVSKQTKQSALLYALVKKHFSVVKELAEAGADLNLPGLGNQSAIIVATIQQNQEMVEYLGRKNAALNIKLEESGQTALVMAACQGKASIVRTLLELGADKTVKDKKGIDAIACARLNEHEEIIRLLQPISDL